jgi:hypothetical protein
MKTKALRKLLILSGILFALSGAWLGYALYDLFANDANPFNYWPILPFSVFMTAYQIIGVAYDKSKFTSKNHTEEAITFTPIGNGYAIPSNSQTPVKL